MKLLPLVLLLVVGCGSDVARLRSQIVTMQDHFSAITTECDKSEPEIEVIREHSISGGAEAKSALKTTEGVQDKPKFWARLGNILVWSLVGLIAIGGVLVYLVMRSKLLKTGVALAGVGVGVVPPGIPRRVAKAIESQAV